MEVIEYNSIIHSKITGTFLAYFEQICFSFNGTNMLDGYGRIEHQGIIYDSYIEYCTYYGTKEGVPQIWILWDNDDIQGFAMGFIPNKITPYIPDYIDYSPNFYLGSLYVLPRYQSNGSGSLLLNNIKNYCKSKGYHQIFLNVDFHNTKAFKYYSKRGFYVTKKNEKNQIYFMSLDL